MFDRLSLHLLESCVQDEAEVTAEDMEAYRVTKARADDPMNAMAASASNGYDMV